MIDSSGGKVNITLGPTGVQIELNCILIVFYLYMLLPLLLMDVKMNYFF